MHGKLFQRCTQLLYCSVLSLGGNVNTRQMSEPDMGFIFHIKNQWNASILVYKFRPERTGFNMYAEYTQLQLTFLPLNPCLNVSSTVLSLCCTVLHCIWVYRNVLYCTWMYLLYCTVLYCTVLYCTVLYLAYYTVPECIYCTVRTIPKCISIVLYCTWMYRVYCTVPKCI